MQTFTIYDLCLLVHSWIPGRLKGDGRRGRRRCEVCGKKESKR